MHDVGREHTDIRRAAKGNSDRRRDYLNLLTHLIPLAAAQARLPLKAAPCLKKTACVHICMFIQDVCPASCT
jgi:hypothetical protein